MGARRLNTSLLAKVLWLLVIFVLIAGSCLTYYTMMTSKAPKFGEVTAFSHSLAKFDTNEKIEGVNTEQKKLTCDSSCKEDGITFGSQALKDDAKNVIVFLPTSEQRSGDFLLMNQKLLKYYMESGDISITVKPLLTGDIFGVYFFEALSEVAYTHPDKAWSFMVDVLTDSRYKLIDKGKDDIAQSLTDTAHKLGITDVDSQSIQNGTFALWLNSFSEDKLLKQLQHFPLIFIDSTKLPDDMNFNNVDEVKNAIFPEKKNS